MDFTNEINTLESEKLRLEEMLKRNNDRLQLLKKDVTVLECKINELRDILELKNIKKRILY